MIPVHVGQKDVVHVARPAVGKDLLAELARAAAQIAEHQLIAPAVDLHARRVAAVGAGGGEVELAVEEVLHCRAVGKAAAIGLFEHGAHLLPHCRSRQRRRE